MVSTANRFPASATPSPRLTRARCVRRVGPGSIDLTTATLVERIKEAFYLIWRIEPDDGIFGRVPNLVSRYSSWDATSCAAIANITYVSRPKDDLQR